MNLIMVKADVFQSEVSEQCFSSLKMNEYEISRAICEAMERRNIITTV